MNLTIYSFIMAIIWFDIFVLLGSILQRKLCLFLNYNFFPIVLLIILSLIRLFAPVETPLTIILPSDSILPAIQGAFKTEVTLGNRNIVPLGGIVVAVASVISIILLFCFFRACWKEHQMVRRFVKTDDKRLLGLMDEIVQKTKPRQGYKLCVFNHHLSPAIWGLWNPVIILPRAILSMTDQEIHYILMHEWRHFLEKDLWAKLFIKVMSCVMWWNPAVYLLKKDIDQTFELKCDLKTTGCLSEEERLDYLSTLLRVARMQQQDSYSLEKNKPIAIYFTGSVGRTKETDANALQRFQTVLKYRKRNRKIEIFSIACLLVLFLVSFRFVVQPFILAPMDALTEPADPNKDRINILKPTADNAYIFEHEDGTYYLYFDGDVRELHQEEVSSLTHDKIPIVKEN